jgi:hypothetical protein
VEEVLRLNQRPSRRTVALALIGALALQTVALAADLPETPVDTDTDTVVVTGTREAIERQIQTFVSSVTRMDGDLIGRWRESICPMVVGLTDAQAEFIQRRLIDVQNTVRKLREERRKSCAPNLFVIVTDEADQVLESWKGRDPGMFRWKTRDTVSRSNGSGPVRTWHNAIVELVDGDPITRSTDSFDRGLRRGRLKDSRIQQSATEYISAVVVLVNTREAGKVSLSQIADYVAMVSLAQIDLTATLSSANSILRLFAQPRPEAPPTALTAWDLAFLNGLYRTSYTPIRQRRDISARMTQALAPH